MSEYVEGHMPNRICRCQNVVKVEHHDQIYCHNAEVLPLANVNAIGFPFAKVFHPLLRDVMEGDCGLPLFLCSWDCGLPLVELLLLLILQMLPFHEEAMLLLFQ